MYFFLQPSYHPSWRVFANRDELRPEVHSLLKAICRWGGHDKSEEHGDAIFLGYEFKDGIHASEALVQCFKLIAKLEKQNG